MRQLPRREGVGREALMHQGQCGLSQGVPQILVETADLPREQHEHVLNVLRAGAHLDPELAKTSASAVREIQAHTISRIHAAATNADGTWNARKFYNAADKYARNAPETFKDRPDVLNNLKTINDAGNTLHMDKHYPGGAAQAERTGAVGHMVGAVGHAASTLAHEVPFGGRIVGRAIEKITDKATYEDPNQLSVGMEYVLVNGLPVIAEGKMTGALPGKVLRGSGYVP